MLKREKNKNKEKEEREKSSRWVLPDPSTPEAMIMNLHLDESKHSQMRYKYRRKNALNVELP